MKHITYDLETLGQSYNAPIVQIGAVKFDSEGNILDRFKANISWNSLSKYDFQMDYSTVKWWMEQSDAARESVLGNTTHVNDIAHFTNLKESLGLFQKWIGNLKDYYYWSHANFDAPILANSCKKVKMNVFIPFRLQRDIRTLHMLAGDVEIKRKGTHHDALDDCIYQAKYISEMLRNINYSDY